ncbi:N-acetylglutamate synthase-like GNAT family acetyltransferase [Yoonia maritima]|uniref:N-acetylglutamate synthase-like GNAT family acetyltransferase n=1 Tax=Yoonia maritima TaxID=1435347 RepID=A0A2T0W1F5_9RHOB|nr:GNAT family N-acetyltransferase [Yoonia maritima]PRY78800.1 N-acetylglutamate synthase-like GNAT family acetyltransferase [Yoonia maritima]
MLKPGFHQIPRGMVATVVTHLEMTAPPSTDTNHPGFTFLRHSRANLDWYRALFRAVGEDWLWFSRLHLADDALATILHDPNYEVWTVQQDGQDVGLIEIDHRVPVACELAFFGLTPTMVGKGAGRVMMAHAIKRAFSRSIKRFYVHTCTLDSPQALGFYTRAGFTPTKQEIEIAPDPRLTGHLPRSAGAHIPVFE